MQEVISDLKRCIHHFTLHDEILSKDEEVVHLKKDLLSLLTGKDTPQIQRSECVVSHVSISDPCVGDTTDAAANDEGHKGEDYVSEESDKLDNDVMKVVAKVVEDINVIKSTDDGVLKSNNDARIINSSHSEKPYEGPDKEVNDNIQDESLTSSNSGCVDGQYNDRLITNA